ncbi:hypothetical protein B0H12DRAFT_1125917 [Mycena haematopus]|nr:hypothetical protein B0H12DRAFT_1125917 [Mycena haematopus]
MIVSRSTDQRVTDLIIDVTGVALTPSSSWPEHSSTARSLWRGQIYLAFLRRCEGDGNESESSSTYVGDQGTDKDRQRHAIVRTAYDNINSGQLRGSFLLIAANLVQASLNSLRTLDDLGVRTRSSSSCCSNCLSLARERIGGASHSVRFKYNYFLLPICSSIPSVAKSVHTRGLAYVRRKPANKY